LLFGAEMKDDAIDDIRLALNQGQPLGSAHFFDNIERATGGESGAEAAWTAAQTKTSR